MLTLTYRGLRRGRSRKASLAFVCQIIISVTLFSQIGSIRGASLCSLLRSSPTPLVIDLSYRGGTVVSKSQYGQLQGCPKRKPPVASVGLSAGQQRSLVPKRALKASLTKFNFLATKSPPIIIAAPAPRFYKIGALIIGRSLLSYFLGRFHRISAGTLPIMTSDSFPA